MSYAQLGKQIGNSVAVPVIAAVARQMKKALDEYYGSEETMDKVKAKVAVDNLIKISRVHFYKPIQIAEIFYRKRLDPSMDLL